MRNARMIRTYLARCVALGGIVALAALAPLATAADANQVLDGFAASVAQSTSATEEQRRIVAELVKQLRQTPEDRAAAITESLRLLHPEFKAALAALGEDNLGAAIVGLTKLREAADPYLAADASYFLARAQLLDERFEDSLPLLDDLQNKWADKTALGGEVLFLRGVV